MLRYIRRGTLDIASEARTCVCPWHVIFRERRGGGGVLGSFRDF